MVRVIGGNAMEQSRFEELEAARKALTDGYTINEAITNNISSGVNAQQTVGFIGDVGAKAEEYQTLKSVYNGAIVQGGRGIIGTAKMLNELYAERAMQNGYVKNKEDLMIGWNNVLESSPLQRYNVDNTYLNSLAEGGGQLIGQMGVGLLTGGAGSMAYMGAQIMGNQYLDLKEEGVDTQRAAAASAINAAIQAPLEQLSLGKILKGSPASSAIRKKVMQIVESGMTEGFTEFIQEFPEQFTNIWAKNPNLDAQGIGAKWDENASQNVKSALLSGSIGAILGAGGSSARVLQMSIGEKIQENIHKEKLTDTKENIEHIKKTGIKPEYASIVIDNAMQGADNVSIDGEALHQYMQQAGAEKVAETLGVTTDEVQKAAEEGLDVEVSYGKFVGTAVAQGDNFYTSLQDHISFDDANGYSTNLNKLTQSLRKAQEITDTAQAELDTEVNKILDSATEAGVTDAQTNGLRELLISRAMIANPENPAQYFKDHPLEFNNAGKVDNARGLYFQAAYHGSPYRFDKFNLQAVGTGEGAQVHGWGLYFALDRDVAEGYKDRLSQINKNPQNFQIGNTSIQLKYKDTSVTINGEKVDNGIVDALYDMQFYMRMNGLSQDDVDINDALKEAESAAKHWREVAQNGSKGSIEQAEMYERTAEGYKQLLKYGNKVVITQDEMQPTLYKVDIPELDTMLDEEGYFEEQPELVQKAILDIIGDDAYDLSGRKIYKKIVKKYGSPMQASLELKKRGVQGIFYDGRQDGDCAVVFDDQAVNILNSYKQQANMTDKGAISWDAEGKAIINLFKGADASTVIHETGHYFLENFMRDSALDTANEQMKKDRAAILKYAGLTEEQWQKADFEGRRAAHEKLTEAFETYIIEGKAPNRELRTVFKRFSNWLKAVYSSLVNGEKVYDVTKRNPNAAEINDEVRQVFDRWFASEEQIKAAERIDGYFAKLPDVVTNNLTDRQKESIKNFIEKAHDKAVDLMTKDAMQIFKQDRKEAVAKIRKAYLKIAQSTVGQQQVYIATNKLKDVPGWEKANAKTLARKYLSKGGQIYGDYITAKEGIDADIDERINPIVDMMVQGIDKEPRTYWIDKETGLEADVSDLEATNGEELRTGFQFQKVTEDLSAPWWDNYREANGKRIPSKAKMRELAIQAYMGNDSYGILVKESQGLTVEQAESLKEEIAQRKAEMEELLKQQKMLQAQGYQANLFKKFYMSDEMRVWFDMVAEQCGYDSGDAMAKDIQSKPTYNKAVQQYLDDVVQRELPDRLKDPKLAEEATREALYNDDSGMVIAVEQQIIEDYANGVNAKARSIETATKLAQAMKAAAENAAKAEISSMRLKDAMKYSTFVKAERRAAAKAAKALKDGDTELAVTYKRQQAFNHAMVRESLKIRQQVKKNLKFLKRQRKMKKETWGQDYHFYQAAALLQRMGIGRKDFDADSREQTLQQYADEQKALGNDVAIPEWLMNEAVDISSPDALTYEQYQDVINALKNIRELSLAERKQFAIEKDKSWAELKSDIINALAPLKDAFTPVPGERPKATLAEKIRAGLRTTDNLLELMDGWHYGFFSKHFGETLKHCADAETRMVMEFEQRATEAYQKWLPNKEAEKAAEEKVYYEELGASVDKHYLVQMAANLGNEGNARVLCSSVPVGLEGNSIWVQPSESVSVEEATEQTKANLVEFLSKNLTQDDIEYAQSKIDNADRHWEELSAVERRTKGFAPKKVQATPIAFRLADGNIVVMKGGYLPLVRDGQMGSHPASQNSVSDTDPNQGRNIQTLHTNTGTSEARTMASYPVNLNRGAEIRTVMDTIHDICYRETIADFRKILNDQELYGVLKTKLGVANFQQLRELLEKSANPYSGGTDQMEGIVAESASWLRRKTVNAAIMMNIKTSLQNLSNINLFGNAVEGFTQKDAWSAVLGKWGMQATSLKQNELDKFIMSKSVFMKERVLFPDITVKDIVGEGKQNKIEQNVTKWGAMMLAYTDNITAKPVWMAAYEKKINAGATEQEAIDFADTIIRRTLGSSRTQDVSSLMRGGPLFKLFTTFQGFWNTQYNQWEREAGIAHRDWSAGKRKEAAQRLAAFACAKWLTTCLMSVMLGLENPFEEDEKGNTKLKNEIYSYPFSMLGPFGQSANMMLNSLRGTSTYSYRLAAIQSTIDRFNKLARTTNRVIEGKAGGAELTEGLFNVVGPVVGVPDQANKILWNTYDYIFNDMDFRAHDLVARRPKSER